MKISILKGLCMFQIKLKIEYTYILDKSNMFYHPDHHINITDTETSNSHYFKLDYDPKEGHTHCFKFHSGTKLVSRLAPK